MPEARLGIAQDASRRPSPGLPDLASGRVPMYIGAIEAFSRPRDSCARGHRSPGSPTGRPGLLSNGPAGPWKPLQRFRAKLIMSVWFTHGL